MPTTDSTGDSDELQRADPNATGDDLEAWASFWRTGDGDADRGGGPT